jgi:hypothetical protein
MRVERWVKIGLGVPRKRWFRAVPHVYQVSITSPKQCQRPWHHIPSLQHWAPILNKGLEEEPEIRLIIKISNSWISVSDFWWNIKTPSIFVFAGILSEIFFGVLKANEQFLRNWILRFLCWEIGTLRVPFFVKKSTIITSLDYASFRSFIFLSLILYFRTLQGIGIIIHIT